MISVGILIIFILSPPEEGFKMSKPEINLSVVIITYNEEENIRRCLKSLPVGAEIIVLDSKSTDNTCKIAKVMGARIIQRKFTNFADQKNVACAKAGRDWILSVDADEELDDSLRSCIIQTISHDNNVQNILAYRLRRRLVFMGRVMKFGKSGDSPVRLFRNGSRFKGSVHENLDVDKKRTGTLKAGCLYHYSYKDLTDYFWRFNRYTSLIAKKHSANGKSLAMIAHILRPFFEFIYRYFFRFGFLDGYAGYTYALVSSLYAYIKYAKLIESRRS
jgi:glycosyltransferase involved in cell wall biosynthesis